LQVNGLKGVSYSSPELSEDEFVFSCEELWKNGTVGFLPTIISSPDNVLQRNLNLMNKAFRFKEVSRCVIGFHLEGPFISREDGARGAHSKKFVRPADSKWLKKIRAITGNKLKMISLAAETKNAIRFIKSAKNMGITVSLGHQMANSSQISEAVRAGAKALTHLGNGLPQIINRFDNPIWPALAEDRLTAMIIPDGHHLPDSMIKVFIRSKGINGIVAVSDASPMALMPPGKYSTLGNTVVIEKSGRLYNPETGYLVGSWATMKECVRHMRSLKFLSKKDIELISYHNPLRLIGLKEWGKKQGNSRTQS